MNRREFLKGIGAVLVRLLVPKKAENQAPVLRQETCPVISIPIDFYLPIPDDGVPLRREIDTGYREEARNDMPQWETCQCGSQYWTGGDDAGIRCSNCGSPPEMSCFVDLAHD